MTDLLQQAEKIYNDYLAKKIINSAYQDAVISFLYLITRLMISNAQPQPTAKKGSK